MNEARQLERLRAAGNDAEQGEPGGRKFWWRLTAVAVMIVALHLTSGHSYLLFHSLAEAFGVAIACGVFMIGWNARAFMSNNFLLLLGIGYVFVAGLDLLHLLAYKGMGVFANRDPANLAAQLWLAARGLEALSLVIAPLYLERRLRPGAALAAFALNTTVLLVLVFGGWFPVCFVEGSGLTRFKIGGEIAVCLMLGGAGLLLTRRRRRFATGVFRLAMASTLVTIASEAAFTHYHSPYGLTNELGHILKIVSFYLIYEAVIANGLRKPYALLFRELKQSEDDLRRANRELEGFAHTVSHDLKNPLAAVISAGQALEQLLERPSPEAKDLRAMAGIIARSGRKAVDLVNDLLALAEAGQRPAQVREVKVDEVVARVLEERADAVASRKIDVRVDAELGTISAAPAHVYQLFANLIGNAVHHSRSEHAVIELRRLPEAAADGRHHYLVRDNGHGIAAEDLPNIFQPFYRGKNGGHGVGLSTVEKIVKLYGGMIRAYNDGGACFELTLRDWTG